MERDRRETGGRREGDRRETEMLTNFLRFLGGTTCSMLLVQWRRHCCLRFSSCHGSFFKTSFSSSWTNVGSHMLEQGVGQAPNVDQTGLTKDKKGCTRSHWQATAVPDIMWGGSHGPASLTRDRYGCTQTATGGQLRRPLAGTTCGVCCLWCDRSRGSLSGIVV